MSGKPVYIQYTENGKSVSTVFYINVSKRTLSVKTSPSVTEYLIGDELNLSDLQLTYTDTTGTPETITSGYTYSYDKTAIGTDIPVTIKYKNLETTITITVTDTITGPDFIARLGTDVQNITSDSSKKGMIFSADGLTVNISGIKVTGVLSGMPTSLLSVDLRGIDTAGVTSMATLFNFCANIASIDVSSFDTSNVTSMQAMFANCTSLKTLDVSNFNTKNVTSLMAMFYGCTAIEVIDIGYFDCSKVQYIDQMFMNCSNLTTIYAAKGCGINSWDTDNAVFMGCSKLKGAIEYQGDSQGDSGYASTDGYFTAKTYN